MALELQLSAPGEWTLKRYNVELGKVRCTGQTAMFALIDPKNPLTASEYEELTKLARQVMGNLSAGNGRATEEERMRYLQLQEMSLANQMLEMASTAD